jgi:hypothetical protein
VFQRILAITIAAVTGVIAIALTPTQANAATPAGWADWLMPTGTVCVQTGGSVIAAQAAVNWDKTDIPVVAKTSCTGHPRNMTVVFVGYNDPAEYACAKTGSSAGWTRQNVRGVSILTPNAPTIWVNYATNWRNQCRRTSAQVAHVYSHELGHVWGLKHITGASVMAAWQYTAPTWADIDRVNRRY